LATSTDIRVIGGSPIVRDAYDLLTSQHDGQRQRVNGRPYVEHPISVAKTVSDAGYDQELVAAALLHDIVEDSELTVDDLRERYGDRIADLVGAMTDEGEVKPYERRKALHRQRVAGGGPESVAIYAADKLDNMRALRSAYAEEGEAVGERFKQPLETKLRVWEADAEMVSGYSETIPYAAELRDEVEALRAYRLSRP
jgi:(p)ppGpp synthase/HD superfamily hydrolase